MPKRMDGDVEVLIGGKFLQLLSRNTWEYADRIVGSGVVMIAAGLVQPDRRTRFQNKLDMIERLTAHFKSTRVEGATLWDLLRRPNGETHDALRTTLDEQSREIAEAISVDAKYEGYLAKQERLAAVQHGLDSKRIPADVDYEKIEHLRAEAKEKLTAFKPATLGHASRLSGITPADITVLQVYLKRSDRG